MSCEPHYDITKRFFELAGKSNQGFFDEKDSLPYRAQEAIRQAAMRMLRSESEGQTVSSILDAGCGRADFSLQLATAFPQASVTGIDFSHAMLSVAQASNSLSPNLHLAAADLRQLPFSNPFDLVVCLNTLHHIHPNDRDGAIAQLARLARGTLLLEIKNKNLLWYGLRAASRIRLRSWQHEPISLYPATIVEMRARFHQHGLRLKDTFVLWKSEMISPLTLLRFDRI